MSYQDAVKTYSEFNIDVEKAIERVNRIPISMHCWQGDDINGFESVGSLTGGIQVTGNYPGKARGKDELMSDIDKALSFCPGKMRINLHAIYAITNEKIERDNIKKEYFDEWIEFAKSRNLGIDFNPTFFSHEMVKDNLTLSSPDESVRAFWVRHAKTCREVAEYIGRKLDDPVLCNIWVPDGYKDVPADRVAPRMRLKKSLDEIYAVKYDSKYIIDCVESKVFGIGLESYTVGSNEFYQNYAAHTGVYSLLDNGHYHPLEYVSDKIPTLLCFYDKVALHVTRGVRWDSDHVVLLEDELKEIAKEIIRNDADEKVLIGLDYFDASINRIVAWATGVRNMRKALLLAALLPNDEMKNLFEESNFSKLMALSEETKTLPFGEVWSEYLRRQNVLDKMDWYSEAERYERDVLSKRV